MNSPDDDPRATSQALFWRVNARLYALGPRRMAALILLLLAAFLFGAPFLVAALFDLPVWLVALLWGVFWCVITLAAGRAMRRILH